MMLAELAHLVGVGPKWVLNTMAALGRADRYSLALARRLALTHAIVEATSAPVARAFELAEQTLRAGRDGTSPVIIPQGDREVALWIDVRRILSSFNVRLSVLRTAFAPRQRGRLSARRRNPLDVATAWGIDLTLLADNARKSVEQRLRQLDAMVAFSRGTQRLSHSGR